MFTDLFLFARHCNKAALRVVTVLFYFESAVSEIIVHPASFRKTTQTHRSIRTLDDPPRRPPRVRKKAPEFAVASSSLMRV